ncbi:hypothetical protein TNCV_3758711 [Trichonephila clavipes]|nr:hypothetical protein TNCV_3758711 [Trichonephila clavipes]
MDRCPEQVVSLKRDPQCLSPQASLVLIYRPTTAGMKGGVDLTQPGNRTRTYGVEARYATTRPLDLNNHVSKTKIYKMKEKIIA